MRVSWDKLTKWESVNFVLFVNQKSKFDDELKDQLDHAQRNVAYLSALIQNEIVSRSMAASHEKVVAEISGYWNLMADETQHCYEVEQLSMCSM